MSVAEILTSALAEDPFLRWLLPSDGGYREGAAAFLALLAEPALAAGTFWLAEGTGAAIWYPPGIVPSAVALDRTIRRRIAVERQADYRDTLVALAEVRPRHLAWQLSMIGVLTEARGQGLARSLIAAGLEQCDARREAVTVDATNPKSAGIYPMFGFAPMATIQCGDAPEVRVLRRPKSG